MSKRNKNKGPKMTDKRHEEVLGQLADEVTEQADDAGEQAAEETQVQAETVVKDGKATPGILQVKTGVALRGARQAWYARLCEFNGKPVAEFLANTAEKPPSVPKSGNAEKPSGWLRYFQRTGVASVVAEASTESAAA